MAADAKLYLLLTSNHSLVEEEEEEEELLLAVINPHISPPDFSSILQTMEDNGRQVFTCLLLIIQR